MATSGSSVEILLTGWTTSGTAVKILSPSGVQWDASRVEPLRKANFELSLPTRPGCWTLRFGAVLSPRCEILKVLVTVVGRSSNAAGMELNGRRGVCKPLVVEDLVAGTGPSPTLRRQAATQLAIRQALTSAPETPISELELPEAIDELVRDGICQRDQGRIRFSHGLYGDWIRANHLESLTTTRLAFLLDQASAPSWHRALRLYLLGLDNLTDPSSWRKILDDLDAGDAKAVADIALDALMFADDEAGSSARCGPHSARRTVTFSQGAWPLLACRHATGPQVLRRRNRRFDACHHSGRSLPPSLGAALATPSEVAGAKSGRGRSARLGASHRDCQSLAPVNTVKCSPTPGGRQSRSRGRAAIGGRPYPPAISQ